MKRLGVAAALVGSFFLVAPAGAEIISVPVFIPPVITTTSFPMPGMGTVHRGGWMTSGHSDVDYDESGYSRPAAVEYGD